MPSPRLRPAESPRLSDAMSKTPLSPRELIDRLDSRHDELIERIDELNAQIERALAEVYRNRNAASVPAISEARALPRRAA